MKAFMDADFLLDTEAARTLYHDYAEQMPILDYHNHLSAQEIYERRHYRNLTELWLAADHYRWSAMRLSGVEERLITGDAPDFDKFCAFAKILPNLVGHPVYHWTHLELKRYFGIETPLCAQTAAEIWDKTCTLLQSDGFDAVSLLQKMQVLAVCTTDDPTDALSWHQKCALDESLPFKVYPSFRPDRFLQIEKPAWKEAVRQLGAGSFSELTARLSEALDRFVSLGCRSSDHGFTVFRYAVGDADAVMQKALDGQALSEQEIAVFQGGLLHALAKEYEKRDMVMQLHIGAMRNNSPKLFALLGADAGGDSVAQTVNPQALVSFLGDLEKENALPKTVLYSLNEADYSMLATMALTFASGGARVRFGAAWWFQDHQCGIDRHLDCLMQFGLLPNFPGMLTDSRSITSFVRHEYFRRILCRKLGELAERGEYGGSIEALGGLVRRLCFGNTDEFFGFHAE